MLKGCFISVHQRKIFRQNNLWEKNRRGIFGKNLKRKEKFGKNRNLKNEIYREKFGERNSERGIWRGKIGVKNSERKIQKKQSSFGFRNELINNSCIEVLEYVIFVYSIETTDIFISNCSIIWSYCLKSYLISTHCVQTYEMALNYSKIFDTLPCLTLPCLALPCTPF